jgi:hypothetical protein
MKPAGRLSRRTVGTAGMGQELNQAISQWSTNQPVASGRQATLLLRLASAFEDIACIGSPTLTGEE